MTDAPPARRRWYLPDPKDVVWAVALLTIGFGGNWLLASGLFSFDAGVSDRVEYAITSAIALCFVAAIGAGFGAVLKRKLLGAAIAAFAVGSIMMAILFV